MRSITPPATLTRTVKVIAFPGSNPIVARVAVTTRRHVAKLVDDLTDFGRNDSLTRHAMAKDFLALVKRGGKLAPTPRQIDAVDVALSRDLLAHNTMLRFSSRSDAAQLRTAIKRLNLVKSALTRAR